MPGLYGLIDFAAPPDSGQLESLERWISGQDCISFGFENERVALGFKSLGIVDHSSQPWQNESTGLTFFLWGELYDPQPTLAELGKEIADRQRSGSLERLKSLNGLFSFALWDAKNQRLLLGSDIYASRPLFYHAGGQKLLFAPSPFAVAAAVGQKQIDPETLSEFLSFGLISGEKSWLAAVKRLRAGHYLVFDRSGLKIERYYRPRYQAVAMSRPDAAAGLLEHLCKAIAHTATPQCALSLSGGGDSRLLLALTAEQKTTPPTFTFGAHLSEDRRIAAKVADAASAQHHDFEIKPDYLSDSLRDAVLHTHGQVAALNFHGFSTRTEVKQLGDICLSGLWGNNHLGYLSFRQRFFKKLKERQQFKNLLCASLGAGFRPSNLLHLIRGDEVASPYQAVDRLIAEYQQENYLETLYLIDCFELNSVRSLAGWWLENDLLEFRSPYCDYDLMRFSLTIPAEQKLLLGVGRELWRKHFPTFGRIEYQRTGLPLTASVPRIVMRRLLDQARGRTRPPGIFDYDAVFRDKLSGWLNQMLCRDHSQVATILDTSMVKQTVVDHLDGGVDNTEQLALLLTLEQVLRLVEEI